MTHSHATRPFTKRIVDYLVGKFHSFDYNSARVDRGLICPTASPSRPLLLVALRSYLISYLNDLKTGYLKGLMHLSSYSTTTVVHSATAKTKSKSKKAVLKEKKTRLQLNSEDTDLDLEEMIPNGAHGEAKRKAEDNPLLKPAKKQKKDGKSTKRKLAGAEETRGGLLIVRDTSTQLSSQPKPPSQQSQPSHKPPSQTSHPPQPPAKKFRSIPPSLQQQLRPPATPDPDPALERAVRDMNVEAAHIRRTSRAVVDGSSSSGSGGNPFAFPVPREEGGEGAGAGGRGRRKSTARPLSLQQGKGKEKERNHSRSASKLGNITDTSQPIPVNETPQQQRNKLLREGSLALITGEGEDEEERGRGSVPGDGRHRRKSSLSRGKRISSRYEGGVITQPHPSVSDSTFFKHIDADLPDSERIRQLLIWCSLRASGSTLGASSFTPSKPKPSASLENLPSPSSLPVLSEKGKEVLKKTQDELVRMIAEKKVDLSLFKEGMEVDEGDSEMVENEQNVRNRGWEVVYGGHIKKAQEEEESWKKVSYAYEAYVKKVQAGIEKDLSAAANSAGPSRRDVSLEPDGAPMTPSSKAKGKQREARQIRLDDLPEDLQRGCMLARSLMSSSSRAKGKAKDSLPLPTQTTSSLIEAEIRDLLPDVQYKLDFVYSCASRARAVTRVIEEMIDERFEVLGRHLDVRVRPLDEPAGSGTTRLLSTYLPHPSSSSSTALTRKDDPRSILRALSRIDSAKPQAMGDAARKAAREAQRVHVPLAGERRLTVVHPGMAGLGGMGLGTPRKAPGTPRRGGTPGRDRERER